MQVAAVDSRKSMLLSLESFQISHAHVRRMLWLEDLQPSIYMYSVAPQATNWFVLGEGVLLRANPGLIKNFDILDDGSQPELGSVLL